MKRGDVCYGVLRAAACVDEALFDRKITPPGGVIQVGLTATNYGPWRLKRDPNSSQLAQHWQPNSRVLDNPP